MALMENTDAGPSADRLLLQNQQKNPLVRSMYHVLDRVDAFKARAKVFYFEVVLSAHPCPKCQGQLAMAGISECLCSVCGYSFDPTIDYQDIFWNL